MRGSLQICRSTFDLTDASALCFRQVDSLVPSPFCSILNILLRMQHSPSQSSRTFSITWNWSSGCKPEWREGETLCKQYHQGRSDVVRLVRWYLLVFVSLSALLFLDTRKPSHQRKALQKKRTSPGRNSRLRKLTATRTTQQWRSEPFTSTFQKTNSLNSVGA